MCQICVLKNLALELTDTNYSQEAENETGIQPDYPKR